MGKAGLIAHVVKMRLGTLSPPTCGHLRRSRYRYSVLGRPNNTPAPWVQQAATCEGQGNRVLNAGVRSRSCWPRCNRGEVVREAGRLLTLVIPAQAPRWHRGRRPFRHKGEFRREPYVSGPDQIGRRTGRHLSWYAPSLRQRNRRDCPEASLTRPPLISRVSYW